MSDDTIHMLSPAAKQTAEQGSVEAFAEKLAQNPELEAIFKNAARALYSSVSLGSVVDVSDDSRRKQASNVAYGIVERVGQLFKNER